MGQDNSTILVISYQAAFDFSTLVSGWVDLSSICVASVLSNVFSDEPVLHLLSSFK